MLPRSWPQLQPPLEPAAAAQQKVSPVGESPPLDDMGCSGFGLDGFAPEPFPSRALPVLPEPDDEQRFTSFSYAAGVGGLGGGFQDEEQDFSVDGGFRSRDRF